MEAIRVISWLLSRLPRHTATDGKKLQITHPTDAPRIQHKPARREYSTWRKADATSKTLVTSTDRAYLLVVGASFAGVACAIEAARANLRVILIERKTDAGEKLHHHRHRRQGGRR